MSTITSESKWKIGSIVALNSHFYSEEDESNVVVITGEPKLISPLMVVVETLIEKSSYDENTGMMLSDKDHFQCKCIWFSHKNFQFEEAWISSRLLKIIKNNIEQLKQSDIKYGVNIEFKTSEMELGKKKSALKQNDDKISFTTTSDLNFVSPIMQVVGNSKVEIKDPLFDPKTNKQKRFISKGLVKCKYHNPNSDKLAEVSLPIESLKIITSIDDVTINEIKKAIKAKSYLLLEIKSSNSSTKTIVSPKKINFRSGRYFLNAYDYRLSKTVENNLNDIASVKTELKYFIKELPRFDFTAGKLHVTNINKDEIVKLVKEVGNDKHIHILYEDINESKTDRTVHNYQIIIGKEKDSEGKEYDQDYLKAFCLLRNSERFFRIDRIKKMQVLNL